MPRLYRPHIPIAIKVKVAERQTREHGALWDNYCAIAIGESDSTKIAILLSYLADALGCERKDLRLDHDPPLGARPKHRRGLAKGWFYTPDANDPDHLFYRPHGAQYAGSHDIKTRVRGDHGQYSDIQLIKRQRRRERPAKPKKAWGSRPMPKGKSRWAKRPFPSRKD